MAGKTETATKDGETAEGKKGKGGKKKLIMIVLPVLLVVVGAGWFLFLKPSGGSKEEPPPTPGVVVTLEPITINLAGGHFLKLGMALQPSADAKETDGAKALDAAINLFSGESMTELATKEGREHAKAELVKEITELYEKEVYDIYFTEFVMQ